MALAGCNAGGGSAERVDYGAGIVARHIVKAEAKCTAAGAPSVYECTDLPRSPNGERLAAAMALDVYKTFQGTCYPDLGMSKCEALVEQAYKDAKSR